MCLGVGHHAMPSLKECSGLVLSDSMNHNLIASAVSLWSCVDNLVIMALSLCRGSCDRLLSIPRPVCNDFTAAAVAFGVYMCVSVCVCGGGSERG